MSPAPCSALGGGKKIGRQKHTRAVASGNRQWEAFGRVRALVTDDQSAPTTAAANTTLAGATGRPAPQRWREQWACIHARQTRGRPTASGAKAAGDNSAKVLHKHTDRGCTPSSWAKPARPMSPESPPHPPHGGATPGHALGGVLEIGVLRSRRGAPTESEGSARAKLKNPAR